MRFNRSYNNNRKELIDKYLHVLDGRKQITDRIIIRLLFYADSYRIGLIGVSIGAHIIYYNIAKERNPKIKVALALNHSPSWVNFVRRYVASIPDGNIRFSENEIIEVEKYMETIVPLNYYNKFNDFPLLILNGKMDKLIPRYNIKKR